MIIGSGNTVFANSYVADADAGEIVLEVSRALGVTNTGRLNVSNGGLDLSNDTVEIAVAATTEGLIDETIVNAIVGNTAAAIGPGQFIDDSFLYDFELVANGNNFDLVITANSINGITDTQNNLVVANTIFNNLADVDSEALGQLRSALGSASSQAEFNDVLESVQPTVDGGYAMASLNIRNDVTNAINNRVNTLFEQRKFPQKTKKIFSGGKNLVTGRVNRDPIAEVLNEPRGSAWIQPFVKSAAQSQKDGIEGYDLNTTGIIIGADTGDLRKDNLLGMTLVAARSDVDSDNANATQTQIDTYGVSIFGGAKMSAKTLLSGSLSYAQSDNDTRRTQIAGIAENVAEGDFFTQHIGFNSKVSHRYKTKGNWTFTPSASVDYDYILANSYNETGDTDLALSVDYDALNMLALGVGLDVDYLYKTVNGVRINPSAYARYKYDFLNRGVRATSILRAASETPDMPATLINTAGFDPQRSVFNMGGNVEAELTDVWRLAMGYDLGLRKDYIAHTGHVNLLRKF